MQGMQRFVRLLLVVAFAVLAVTSMATVVQAADAPPKGDVTLSGCWFEWRDTGMCCECWWPGEQDWRGQWLVCPNGREEFTGYYKCACPSWCSK